MNTEVTIIADTAQTIYVSHPTSSYGIFCYNSKGDLFLNSDYGMYGYAWRSYGPDNFSSFLAQCNAEYIVGKFEINYRQMSSKKLNKHWRENVVVLVEEFIKFLKMQNT